MDTVLHGEENYQKNYHLLRDILVHFCNTFYRCYSKYMRDVNWKSPTTAFCLYNPRRPPGPPSPPPPPPTYKPSPVYLHHWQSYGIV